MGVTRIISQFVKTKFEVVSVYTRLIFLPDILEFYRNLGETVNCPN